ncbi:hypothetical protein C5167_026900 [Papaver somniferum]|uniref:GDSL esterase/lipase At4g16230-like n=1 Tax=Papaver somniferum TaxID=3469 RepID=UPI000E6FF014|nr:GDSL esterase/lipase At4g16230-like [Papaver somniferum]RZC92266.1 hypothetical protein C5167_026900 [Papaver somniferum]
MNYLLMILLLVFSLSCGTSTSSTTSQGNDSGFQRPALYILGDSLVDVGNNNYIHFTITKNNFLPYGIDFPRGKISTGRYSNGRTVIDIIGETFGLEDYIPPYMDPTTIGDVVLRGVNYASGGGGILNETGAILGNRINMDAQLDNFANTRNYIISTLGDHGANEFLAKALFIVVMGSNDFIDNYFIPFLSIPEQKLLTPKMFVDILISRFRLQLTRLHEMGARKIAVANVGPVGCIPLERRINGILNKTEWHTKSDSCISEMNDAVMYFNKKLNSLVMELNSEFVESKFLNVDIYGLFTHVIDNYQSYGFENYKDSCCQTLPGPLRGLLPCNPKGKVCEDRSKYVFWDEAHPTDATYSVFAKKLLERNSKYVYPYSIQQVYYA